MNVAVGWSCYLGLVMLYYFLDNFSGFSAVTDVVSLFITCISARKTLR